MRQEVPALEKNKCPGFYTIFVTALFIPRLGLVVPGRICLAYYCRLQYGFILAIGCGR